MSLGKLAALAVVVSSLIAEAQSFHTTVDPLPNENQAGKCSYDLTIPEAVKEVHAVFVLYDRGQDIMRFYGDPDVGELADKHDLALMMAHQCPAKRAPGGPEEMDMDPSHGIGRAMFTALDQFAHESNHPELSSAKVILLGFSGTGALFAHFVGFSPERVVAAILANPGHYDPVGMDNVELPPAGIRVPEMIMVGGADKISGTERPYQYFRRYREQGAPWAFVVQNQTPHCCVINAKSLIVHWLDEIIKLREPSATKPLRDIDQHGGWLGYVGNCSTKVIDGWGDATWNACGAVIKSEGKEPPRQSLPAGWFPNKQVANEWLEFVKQPYHPVTSLP